MLALLTTLTLSLGFVPSASAQTTTCGAPDLGGRVEVWSATLTPGPISLGGGTLYGYADGEGGALSDTSFEFGGRTATVTFLGGYAYYVELKIDVEFDPVTDQEFIGVDGLPSLRALRLHYCNEALDLSADTDGLPGIVGWGASHLSQNVDWSSVTTMVVALSVAANSSSTGHPSIEGSPKFRSTLTAGLGNIDDPNGLEDAVYSYQWVRIDKGIETDIPSADGSTYSITSDDIDKSLKVAVTFTDDHGYSETRSSNPVGPVTALTCTSPALGGRVEVWSATLTPGPISLGGGTLYGYADGEGGALSDTSFEFGGRTATVTFLGGYAYYVELKIDVEFDPVTDQEFIGVDGLPSLRALRLHYCNEALDLSADTDGLPGIVGWGASHLSQNVDWSSVTTMVVALSAPDLPNNPATGTPTITGSRSRVR